MSHPQPLGFAGKELDPETGTSSSQALSYFGARYLHSATGRFTAVDPVFTIKENIFDPQRWNRYAYVQNNPLRYVDPDGRNSVPVEKFRPSEEPVWPGPRMAPGPAASKPSRHEMGPSSMILSLCRRTVSLCCCERSQRLSSLEWDPDTCSTGF